MLYARSVRLAKNIARERMRTWEKNKSQTRSNRNIGGKLKKSNKLNYIKLY